MAKFHIAAWKVAPTMVRLERGTTSSKPARTIRRRVKIDPSGPRLEDQPDRGGRRWRWKARTISASRSVDLHYSVNGAPEKTVALPKSKGAKRSTGTTTLSLEDFKLVPGDVVSLYATRQGRADHAQHRYLLHRGAAVRDASTRSRSRWRRRWRRRRRRIRTRSPSAQKEIIAATWNQLKDAGSARLPQRERGVPLRRAGQAARPGAIAGRAHEGRQLSGTNEEFKSFVKDMDAAVEAMGPAVGEAEGRRVAGRAGARAEGAAAPAARRGHVPRRFRSPSATAAVAAVAAGRGGRDLENLFDLELDTEKNQYESRPAAGIAASSGSSEIDEALQKLEQLARRQQELADQQRQNRSRPPSSAGSRRCCAAKPRSCSGRWRR